MHLTDGGLLKLVRCCSSPARMLLASGAVALSLPTNGPVVVLGPGSLDMRLLTAKLAARSGRATTLFSASGAAQDIWLEQMYEVEDPSVAVEDTSDPLRPVLASGPAERASALASAEALALISDGVSMPKAALSSVLDAAPLLKLVVCLSKMGVTRSTASPLGLGTAAASSSLRPSSGSGQRVRAPASGCRLSALARSRVAGRGAPRTALTSGSRGHTTTTSWTSRPYA